MRTLLALLLPVGGLIFGCQSDEKMADRGDKEEGTPVSRGSAKTDWNSLHSDPVCDMTVNPKTAVSYEYYGGQIYYFDSDKCHQRFHENPQVFVPGARVFDPVCNLTLPPRTAVASETYDGKTYYFDSEECSRSFHNNPQVFVPGARVVDPVCSMNINPKTAVASETYSGKIYYFDSDECFRRFHNNPQVFVPADQKRPVQEVK